MTTTEIPTIDQAKLEAFVGQAVVDMGAAISGLLLHLGDRLGLYKAMAGAGPITSAELARAHRHQPSGTSGSGSATRRPAATSSTTRPTRTYELPAEQAMVVANEDSPVFLAGAFETIASCYADHDLFVDAFRTGAGIGWHAHDDRLFSGVVRLFRPGYAAYLVDGVAAGARRGRREAARRRERRRSWAAGSARPPSSWPRPSSTRRSAGSTSTSPRSRPPARPRPTPGVESRATFDVATAQGLPRHRVRPGLPVRRPARHGRPGRRGAPHPARRWRRTARCCWSSPTPATPLEENLNPVGRAYYGLSTVICTPGSLAQDVGLGLGAQAGERRLTAVLHEAGFSRVRRATETPLNIILEARP